MRDMKYMRDICDMLYGATYFYILLIYYIYRAKNITNIKYKIFRISHSGPWSKIITNFLKLKHIFKTEIFLKN